jgi:hypothetical protein
MLKINILSGSQKDPFFAQWDKQRYPEADYYIRENAQEDLVWDLVIVYENLREPQRVRCRQGGLIYVAGEPPLMRPLPQGFVRQFDEIYVPNRGVRHPHKVLSHGFLNWSLGVSFTTKRHKYTFEQLARLETPKTRNISIVTSTKKMMPGHNRRMKLIAQLKRDFPDAIDFYGMGDHFVEYKADALIPYRFHICLENSTIPYYWTEKFADPVLAHAVPIYLGCTNIDQYFDPKGYIAFSDKHYEQLKIQIQRILDSPEEVYQTFLPYVLKNKETLMSRENLIPFAIRRCQAVSTDAAVEEHRLLPMNHYPSFKYLLYGIRLQRLLYKVMFPLLKK